MTEAQREAHKRLMQILPVRTHAEEIENWPEEWDAFAPTETRSLRHKQKRSLSPTLSAAHD